MEYLRSVVDAHTALLSPHEHEESRLKSSAVCFATAFALCGLFHACVARHFKKPYFLLHVFVNAIITALVIPGAIRACLYPLEASVPAPGARKPEYVSCNRCSKPATFQCCSAYPHTRPIPDG